MNRLTPLLPAALLAAAVFPAGADDKAVKGDLAKLQGTWATKVGFNRDINTALTIKGNAVTLRMTPLHGEAFEVKGEVRLDEQAKPHKAVDWVNFKDPRGEPVRENLGIYEFTDKDTLKLCNGGPGYTRPIEFKAGLEDLPQLVIMTRRAEPDAPRTSR